MIWRMSEFSQPNHFIWPWPNNWTGPCWNWVVVRQVKLETAYRRWRAGNGQEVVKVAPLSLRYTFPAEMVALLHATGFELSTCSKVLSTFLASAP